MAGSVRLCSGTPSPACANKQAWLPVHAVRLWALQSHLHITSHRQTMDCSNKWHASHWRNKELRRSKGQRLELSQKSMQVMEAVSIVLVSLIAVLWLLVVAGMVCCHVHQLRERRRLRKVHQSYFRQWWERYQVNQKKPTGGTMCSMPSWLAYSCLRLSQERKKSPGTVRGFLLLHVQGIPVTGISPKVALSHQ